MIKLRKSWVLIIVGIIFLAVGVAWAAYDMEEITVADSVIGLTAGKYAGKNRAFLTLETGSIKFTFNGTDPTSAFGHPLEPGQSFTLVDKNQIKNFKAIRTTATSGKLTVTYFYVE